MTKKNTIVDISSSQMLGGNNRPPASNRIKGNSFTLVDRYQEEEGGVEDGVDYVEVHDHLQGKYGVL